MIIIKYLNYLAINVMCNLRYRIRYGGDLNIFFGCSWTMFKKDMKLEEKVKMEIRDENLQVLNAHGYAIEELSNGRIDLYNDRTYLFVDQFQDHIKLGQWIKENLKEEK